MSFTDRNLRSQFRTYLRTVWIGAPVSDYRLVKGAVPDRRFAILTASFPRRATAPDPEADARENERLRDRIARAGFEALPVVGKDPEGPHGEASYWVWATDPREAIDWGREFDQVAIVAGDGLRHGLLACFPEDEPARPPDHVRLLGGAGVLIEPMRKIWSTTRFTNVPDPDDPAMLTIGFGAEAIAAAASESPWRIAVEAPWATVDPAIAQHLADWPGLTAIFAGKGDAAHVRALPSSVPRIVDSKGSRDPVGWIDRIARHVVDSWNDAR